MGKTIGIASFLLVLLVSIIIFLTRGGSSPREQFLNNVDNEPRVVLEDFAVYRYNNDKVDTTLSAKLGHFLEPNVVEAYASVRGVRYKKKNRIESLQCESATGYLVGDSMNELLSAKGTELARAEVEDHVQIGFDDHTMNTEFAEYIASFSTVSSNEEVRVDGPNRTLFGKDGFVYNLKKEFLEMNGAVSGVVSPERKINR